MNILSLSVSLTVNNVKTSSEFLIKHFGFKEKIAADGFASLIHEKSGINVIYMQTGIDVLPEFLRNVPVSGTILAFVTTNLEAEEERLRSEGVAITLPLQTEEWGEKLFMVTDPNGVVIELVEWINQGEGDWQQ
jgi:uncharacterized glyoxalase superfamily protein PhnB